MGRESNAMGLGRLVCILFCDTAHAEFVSRLISQVPAASPSILVNIQ